jgi:hypothetical protein
MVRMRYALLSAVTLLTACGQSEPPPPLPEPTVEAVAAPWFICDAIDAPVLLVFERDGTTARVAQYDKPNGALIQRTEYRIGESNGVAGSIYTTLLQNGAEAGNVREINAGALETPGAAYTPLYSSVRLGEREASCRWLPRTRLMGFTGRRTIVVGEDADGDLLYHSYDFATAANAQAIEIAENGRTTTFSLEVRDGAEQTDANGARYQFQADAETEIVVVSGRDGRGRVEVRGHGPNPAQSEDLIAYVQGSGAE